LHEQNPTSERFADIGRSVSRAVIHDDNLFVWPSLVESRLDRSRNPCLTIEYRYADRDLHSVRKRRIHRIILKNFKKEPLACLIEFPNSVFSVPLW
jgi:hypothetical protein